MHGAAQLPVWQGRCANIFLHTLVVGRLSVARLALTLTPCSCKYVTSVASKLMRIPWRGGDGQPTGCTCMACCFTVGVSWW
jgi:hypothetical protein